MGNLALFYKLYQWYTKLMEILTGKVSPPPVDPRDPLTIQYHLIKKGYYVLMTGRMSQETINAIKKFQADKGLNPDGEVGKLTWAALTSGG
jgi:hypothetical protein